ncbi:MAG: YigZ family protein [Oscillospiraceae bacterium]|nr:YigZ family protein [Oscillospiraceae bacterium]
MNEYLVPFETAESEFIEKRSRFISHIWRVESEEEARTHIEEMKKRYYDARHNCWCYIIREGGVVRYSDDGEPQGTAGQPMLNVFQRREISNVCCVVTRYFGGILLGAGGLTRAYTKGAADALSASGVSTVRLWTEVEIPVPYAMFERVKLELTPFGAVITDSLFGADVTIQALLPAENVEPFQLRLTELSAGSLTVQVVGEVFRPGQREEVEG